MYSKEFEIRWSDVDANVHLRNSAYIDFMSHTRMSFFSDNGYDQVKLAELRLGPVALYEHMYYFKEVLPNKPVTVTLKLGGLAENGTFFEYVHDFYDDEGNNLARCLMLGAWINLDTRKLTALPIDIYQQMNNLEKTDDFKVLTKEDTRRYGQRPTNKD